MASHHSVTSRVRSQSVLFTWTVCCNQPCLLWRDCRACTCADELIQYILITCNCELVWLNLPSLFHVPAHLQGICMQRHCSGALRVWRGYPVARRPEKEHLWVLNSHWTRKERPGEGSRLLTNPPVQQLPCRTINHAVTVTVIYKRIYIYMLYLQWIWARCYSQQKCIFPNTVSSTLNFTCACMVTD